MGFEPKYTITDSIAWSFTQIERARGFLEAAKLSDSWLQRMQRQAFVREAHHTTHIEGTQLTLSEAEQLLNGIELNNVEPDDAKELLNYREAFELVSGYLDDGYPVTEALIREIHAKLVHGVRGNSGGPGQYREKQNFVANSVTKEIIYTPPEHILVPGLMQELIDWINADKQVNPVLVAGIAQFQLVEIHPFLDGNGRSARLLSTLCLYRKGYDFKKLFSISEFYDSDRDAYYAAIQSVRNSNYDLTNWLEYFSGGLAKQMENIKTLGESIIKTDLELREEGLIERQIEVMAFVLERGQMNISECEEVLRINRRTLQRDIKQLIERDYLVEVATNPNDPTKIYRPLKK